MTRRSRALEVFAYTNLAVGLGLIASSLLFTMPTLATITLIAAGILIGTLGGYNAFLAHQDLPQSRKSAMATLAASIAVLLVPTMASLGPIPLTVVLVTGMLAFAMSGAELTGAIDTRSLPQAHDRGPP